MRYYPEKKKTCSVIEVDATLLRAGRESLGLRVGAIESEARDLGSAPPSLCVFLGK